MSEVIKKTVLLIEDEVMSNVVNTIMLQRVPEIGQVHDVRNGKEAIRYLEQALQEGRPFPDLIYLDINMPEMNGFEFIEKLKVHPSIDYNKLNIVILTSSIHPTDLSHARELGIVYFFVKPLSEYHIQQSLKLVHS